MPLKSARELAIEKSNLYVSLDDSKKLTPAQKIQIEELRQNYRAKIAEQEIMAQSRIQQLTPEELGQHQSQFEQELIQMRLHYYQEMDAKIQNLMNTWKNEN